METNGRNPYLPALARVERVIEETWDTKTFRVVFQDESLRESFRYEPGQFQEVSVFGVGEATFCLASTPTRPGFVEFSVKKVGTVTTALHELEEGAIVGIRGPFGNWFPYERWKGKRLIFIGGGIGIQCLSIRSGFSFGLINIRRRKKAYRGGEHIAGQPAMIPGAVHAFTVVRSQSADWREYRGMGEDTFGVVRIQTHTLPFGIGQRAGLIPDLE